jgi:para-nitrobenzyl esterase
MAQLIAETKAGPVAGRSENGVRRWLGIPYATARRFAAPEPVPAWTGTRPALDFAPQCPQAMGKKVTDATVSGPGYGEDCLALNIWVPEGGADVSAKPVFFWIHGGAFMAGSSNPYNGEALARDGDIIVVTINYRVGVIGFVNFGEALGIPEIPSNLGLRDQIAALAWVRDNIAAFGGDPKRVTVAGQSAGSMSVSLLMLIPEATPLFQGAIMQSGAVSLIHSRESSIRIARRYAELLDLNQGDLEKLRNMDLKRLLETQMKVGEEIKGGIPAAPWYDGDLLPASLDEARAQATPAIPLLAGATRDEARLFELMPGDILPTKRPALEAMIRAQLPPDHAERLLAAYPATRKGTTALASDLTFGMPTRHFAERHARHSPTWYYRFDYAHPLAGATHGLDLTLFWPFTSFRVMLARGGPFTGRRAALGRRMMRHWAHFTRHGTPEADWPGYDADSRVVRLLNLADRDEPGLDAERYAAWDGRDVAPRSGSATG